MTIRKPVDDEEEAARAEMPEIPVQFAARRRVAFWIMGVTGALALGSFALTFVSIHTLKSHGHLLFGVNLSVWLVVAAALAFLGDRLARRWWRCPKCDQVLGKTWNPLQCERCGVSLRAEGSIVRQVTASFSPEQVARIRREYARLCRRQYIASLPFLLIYLNATLCGFGLTLHPLLDIRNRGMLVTVVVTGAAWLAYSIWNWRCPACRAYLGKTRDGRHCRRCGVQLWE